MATKIMLTHESSGLTKDGFYGFSWTFLFFSGFVSFFRGEVWYGVAHILASVVTAGIWQIIFSFFYNRRYTKRMLMSGWNLTGSEAEILRASMKLKIDPRRKADSISSEAQG